MLVAIEGRMTASTATRVAGWSVRVVACACMFAAFGTLTACSDAPGATPPTSQRGGTSPVAVALVAERAMRAIPHNARIDAELTRLTCTDHADKGYKLVIGGPAGTTYTVLRASAVAARGGWNVRVYVNLSNGASTSDSYFVVKQGARYFLC